MTQRTYLPLLLLPLVFMLQCKADTGTRQIGKATIDSVSPNFVNPGQQYVEGRIYGSNLEGMSSVSLGDGIDIQQANLLSPTEIYLFFSVSDDAVPGPRTVTIFAVEGVTSVDNAFTVGDNHVPKASFAVTPPFGYRSTTFQFDASRSSDVDGNIDSFHWNFGDHQSATGRTITHQFKSAGSFDVTLAVTDNRGGINSFSRFVDVDVSKQPVASFSVSPSSGDLTTTFRYDASSSNDPDGRITGYAWNFGDGNSATGQIVEHRYSRTGVFITILTVSDNTRVSASFSRGLSIHDNGGGGGGGGGGQGQECTESASRQPILYGNVVSFDESMNSVVVQFPSGTTCSQAFVRCGDFRKTDPEKFYGIVRRVFDLGNGQFQIFVDCPPSFPSTPGESVFIIYKTCADNFCP